MIDAIQQLPSPPMPAAVQQCVATMDLLVLLDSVSVYKDPTLQVGGHYGSCRCDSVLGRQACPRLPRPRCAATSRSSASLRLPPPHAMQVPLFKLFLNILQNEDNLTRFVEAQLQSSAKGGLLRCMCSSSVEVRTELLALVGVCQAKQESLEGVAHLQKCASQGLSFEDDKLHTIVVEKSVNLQRHALSEGKTTLPVTRTNGDATGLYWSFWMWMDVNPAVVADEFAVFTDNSTGVPVSFCAGGSQPNLFLRFGSSLPAVTRKLGKNRSAFGGVSDFSDPNTSESSGAHFDFPRFSLLIEILPILSFFFFFGVFFSQ